MHFRNSLSVFLETIRLVVWGCQVRGTRSSSSPNAQKWRNIFDSWPHCGEGDDTLLQMEMLAWQQEKRLGALMVGRERVRESAPRGGAVVTRLAKPRRGSEQHCPSLTARQHQTPCGWEGPGESRTQVGCQDTRASPETHRAASWHRGLTGLVPRPTTDSRTRRHAALLAVRVGAGRFAPGPLRGGRAVSAGKGSGKGLGRRRVTRDPLPPM